MRELEGGVTTEGMTEMKAVECGSGRSKKSVSAVVQQFQEPNSSVSKC